MYEEFYNFSETPFQLVPNPKYLYRSGNHDLALTYLEYGLTHKVGFILLTGEVGSGKTTLIRYLLNEIESDVEAAVIFNTNVTSAQLIVLILQEFDLRPENSKARNIEVLYKFLIGKYAEKQPVLLVIDEAQNLSREALEEVRMISNLQSDEDLLLQIMLVGQPELKKRLKHPSFSQFSQRIAVNYHLTGLSREETIEYIHHRIRKSGGRTDIFTPKAMDAVHEASGGIPRTINLLCDSALIYGFADELKTIDENIVSRAMKELGLIGVYKKPQPEKRPRANRTATGTLQRNGLAARLAALERNQQAAGVKLNWLIDQLEKRANGFKDEFVNELKRMLSRERARSEKLAAENERLKMQLTQLQKRQVNDLEAQKLNWPRQVAPRRQKE
jgi:general secretion pathway protein A